MPVIDVDGLPVHYTAQGSGPGLLLIHGSTADAEGNYGHLRQYFTDRFTVITPDYSGSGKTPLPEGELTVDRLVDQVVAAARETTDQPFDVFGASQGAVVAAAAAARHPGLVRRLVLAGGWARNDDPRQRLVHSLWRRLADLDTQAYADFTTLIGFSPAHLASMGEGGVREATRRPDYSDGAKRQIDLNITLDIRDRLSAITAPTLVIGATQDQLIPPGHSRELHRAIAGSRYLDVDSGHLFLYEKTDEVAAAVNEFLSPGA
ncbi:alpha/beta fold hydrolase [Streptomyces sp. NPDC017529]|uniref:alpha/beta fold hydrolase n=1 Tax=Streptomyces sp. NPDC017529 TaxID=3365000 RepID=UPI0037A29EB7